MSSIAFIVGHYKCGTTWLINMLSLHPDIIGLAETNLFKYAFNKSPKERTKILFYKTAWAEVSTPFIKVFARKILNPVRKYWKPVVGLKNIEQPLTKYSLSLNERYKLKRKLLKIEDPEKYCQEFFGYFIKKFNPKCLIEKSADHVRSIPRIKNTYPNSKLIVVYRDGRDFVVSHRYYAKNMNLPWDFEESVKLWKEMIEYQLQYEKEYGLFSISYEEMLNNNKAIAIKILNFLGLNYTNDILENMIHKSSFEFRTGRKRGEANKKSFYRKGVSGDWRNHFSEKEKEIFKKIAGDLLIKLGYEKGYDW
ncbi:sulfotransferase [Thermodesulfatator indicus DSM 15286]|uniref:Sulfotransferase n=1 Tax=Thermodesulfatator indicus (strain DSM 15286 / JCM 11887 / CIR29812) TaxID=667014 RepID=F8ABK5_THEID|nr:sulfotransferase domain-containing protein [Thermodesulfatator indicus]AEH45602.1 sulfotransferase [Thermodesulfatator indicus DSM 15286]